MKINEIFYSLQGEGQWTGTPMVFVRFSGCNLRCPFCDTQHKEGKEMTEAEIVAEVKKYPAYWAVLTGGEPSLFVTPTLIEAIHKAGKKVAIETNGTHHIDGFPDWITLSPKDRFCENASVVLNTCDELKVVFDGNSIPDYSHIYCQRRYIQPCDTGNLEENTEILKQAIRFCQTHPEWHLSLQTHKILGIQ